MNERVRGFRAGQAVRLAVAIAGPAVATLVGLAVGSSAAVAAASLYLLAVVGAAAFGGLASGLTAAVLSFLGLNYYFTPPHHTFKVSDREDLIALFVFLGVAGIVGGLVARILAERARAERRENESALLNRFMTSLLREPMTRVLQEFARTMVDLFALERCTITVPDLSPIVVEADGRRAGDEVVIPVGSQVSVGTISVVLEAGARMTVADRHLLDSFAVELGLVLERSHLDSAAREARTDAEVSRARAALFSSVTHDLRTPLASIKAGITSLLDVGARHDEARREDLLRTMLEETDRLNRLVGNLLNLARARAGGLALELELTPFEDVVEAVLSRVRPMLANGRLRTIIRPDIPPIWVDPIQMDQALTNILENAVRYAPTGEITISVVPWQSGIQIRVADRGPGIAPEDRQRVFEAFFRSDRSRGGTGLGLAIAEAVVTAHRGSIHVEGVPAGGTAVVIELPAGAAPEAKSDR